jgi:hypothetical protein
MNPDTPMPLFYRQPRVLQPGLHAGRSLAEPGRYGFAAQANAVPLLAAEMPEVARQLPVVFAGGELPHPVAVLGLRARQNLCVDAEGRWVGGAYVPAYLRRYPFIFLEDEARHELTLCIDEAATAAGPGDVDSALFDPAGEPTALTRSALAFCRDYQAHHLLTVEFCHAIAAAHLLVDRHADVRLDDGLRLGLTGLRVIDEARFSRLPAETFLAWRDKGWLPLIYSHLQSIGHWSNLVARGRQAEDGAGGRSVAAAAASSAMRGTPTTSATSVTLGTLGTSGTSATSAKSAKSARLAIPKPPAPSATETSASLQPSAHAVKAKGAKPTAATPRAKRTKAGAVSV